MRTGFDSHHQRLRLSDLGHFGRRRKAFERGREDGVGVGGAGGRLVEFGQRQRGAQFEAARRLAASRRRWRSGSVFARARGWRGRASAAISPRDPMQLRFERAIARSGRLSPALRRGWRRRGLDRPLGLRPRPARFSRGRRTSGCSAARSCSTPRRMSVESVGGRAGSRGRPTLEKHAECAQQGRSCSRARRASSKTFVRARAWSPRINSNMAACILPSASVPTWVRSAIRVCMRSMSEIARSTSPRGHNASAR